MSWPAYQCPRCHESVELSRDAYRCSRCTTSYPLVCGIPDFRIAPDPYIGLDEDRAKSQRLAAAATSRDLRGLVRHYFEITPEVPGKLAESYMKWILETASTRAPAFLELAPPSSPHPRILEVGCGSGPFLPCFAARAPSVVGVDIALRWLVVAERRLAESRAEAELVCGCAESLPFRDGQFDLVVAANVLEHLPDPTAALAEIQRVLDTNGVAVLSTPNRTSLAPDPHVGLVGVGFLPRRLASALAERRRGVGLERVRVRGYLGLRRLFRSAGFREVRFELPEVGPEELAGLGVRRRAFARLYNQLRTRPIGNQLLRFFGPFFRIVAYKGAADPSEANAGDSVA